MLELGPFLIVDDDCVFFFGFELNSEGIGGADDKLKKSFLNSVDGNGKANFQYIKKA